MIFLHQWLEISQIVWSWSRAWGICIRPTNVILSLASDRHNSSSIMVSNDNSSTHVWPLDLLFEILRNVWVLVSNLTCSRGEQHLSNTRPWRREGWSLLNGTTSVILAGSCKKAGIVLHLVIVTKYSTDWSIYLKYYRLTYFNSYIEYAGINYCFANFKYAEGYVNISY